VARKRVRRASGNESRRSPAHAFALDTVALIVSPEPLVFPQYRALVAPAPVKPPGSTLSFSARSFGSDPSLNVAAPRVSRRVYAFVPFLRHLAAWAKEHAQTVCSCCLDSWRRVSTCGRPESYGRCRTDADPVSGTR
jgi:hypothetical protein